MPDFKYIEFPSLDQWVLFSTQRVNRPHTNDSVDFCPFCQGNENFEEEVYRIGGKAKSSDWQLRVIQNKFPFVPIHEVVIHGRTHAHNFGDIPQSLVKMILESYVSRYNTHRDDGSVIIFGNSGTMAGESIIHPHSQIAVAPKELPISVPKLEHNMSFYGEQFKIKEFQLICPPYSQWPDEVWIVPERRDLNFGQINAEELDSLSFLLRRLIRLMTIRSRDGFPHNYYIYPYQDWYLRIIPRSKKVGGFELATGVMVNTQDPRETMAFIKEYFYEEDESKITPHVANYRRSV